MTNDKNRVHRVAMHGGLYGMFMSSQKEALSRGLSAANSEGYEVVQVLPDAANVAQTFVSIIILFCTVLIWCPAPGFLLISRKVG